MATILDEAEQRLGAALTDTQQAQKDGVEAMRDEIGRQHYAQANVELVKLECMIAEEIRPFLTRINALHTKAPTPLPQYVVNQLREMHTSCDKVPPFVRGGLADWKALRVPIWTDGKSIDVNARGTLIYHVRMKLMNWNGQESRLRDLKAQVEQYLSASGWPARQPGEAP